MFTLSGAGAGADCADLDVVDLGAIVGVPQ